MHRNEPIFDEMLQRIRRLVPLTDEEFAFARARYRLREVGRGEALVRAGQLAPDSFYVARGLLRVYYSTSNGKEFVTAFVPEGHTLTVYLSKILSAPSGLSAEALEDCTLVVMPNTLSEELCARFPRWERFFRVKAELYFLDKERRERALLIQSAEERYEAFVATHPDIVDRVPQYQIASYLGVTDVALSRIRRRRAQRAGPRQAAPLDAASALCAAQPPGGFTTAATTAAPDRPEAPGEAPHTPGSPRR